MSRVRTKTTRTYFVGFNHHGQLQEPPSGCQCTVLKKHTDGRGRTTGIVEAAQWQFEAH